MANDQFAFRPQLEEWENPAIADKAPAPAPADPAAEAANSAKRMRYIVAYLRDAQGHPSFADKPLVFRVFSEEHAYQQAQQGRLELELQRLPPSAESLGIGPGEAVDPIFEGLEERRAGFQRELATCRKRQAQFIALMRQVLGNA
ncbi:MAG: hypothetical protein JWM80_1709 [Cyanobacteria bacterium RYN_339]|nr:hypothetical protein [Cyanobacteria bacterium RYN_339]